MDPYSTFRFRVEIDGIQQMGFADVSGLDVTTSVDSIREGGLNDYVHKLPKWTTQTDLVLKKGLTDQELWNWYKKIETGEDVERKNVSVILLDLKGEEAMRWNFIEAYPVKWSGPSLNATSTGSSVAFESLTLAHHGFTNAT